MIYLLIIHLKYIDAAFCLCGFKSLTAFTEIPSNRGYWLHFWEGSSEMVTLHKIKCNSYMLTLARSAF